VHGKLLMAKVVQYLRELRLCWRMGVDSKSRLTLAIATCRFHLANGFSAQAPPAPNPLASYHIHIGSLAPELWLRTYGGDLFVFHEVFLGQCYWVPPQWVVERPVTTVVDLGANIGLTTLFLSQYFPTARYVCVEPNPDNLFLLRHNVAVLREKVHIIEGAISESSGSALFDTSGAAWQGHLLGNQQRGLAVRCYSMSDLITAATLDTIDLLKVDIEGAEQHLFRDPDTWLHRVRIIVIELHAPYSLEAFARDVKRLGFRVIPPDSRHGNRMIFALSSEISS
jgi:FkbM family methyltransferase